MVGNFIVLMNVENIKIVNYVNAHIVEKKFGKQ